MAKRIVLHATDRDRRVTVERAGPPISGPHSDEARAWSALANEWVSVRFGSGAERRVAAQTGVSQAATFGFLWNSRTRTITPADRLLFEGALWNIQSAVILARNVGVIVTAVRAA